MRPFFIHNYPIYQSKLTLTKFNSVKDQFLYTVLKQLNPNRISTCGLKGSVDERIKDCSYQLTSETEGFVLVTRSKDFKEVHKETSTGLLWSDRLPNDMTHYNAEKACNSSYAWLFNGVNGVTNDYDRDDFSDSVRCVAR